MNETQFKIAEYLLEARPTGRGMDAAKSHLVDGETQADAAKKHDVSRQMAFSSINRIKSSYLKALKIKEAFDLATRHGNPLTDADKFDIAMLVINKRATGKGIAAARLVMVNQLTRAEAAKECNIALPTLHVAMTRISNSYEKGLEVKRMFDTII